MVFHADLQFSRGDAQTGHQSSDLGVIHLIEALEPKACTQPES